MVSKTTNCCCYFDLRTGAVLLGIFELVVWSVILTISGLSLTTISGLMVEEAPIINGSSTGIGFPQEFEESKEAAVENPMYSLYIMLILSVALSTIRILNGSILLLGVHMNSTTLLQTWLSIKIFSFFVTMGSFVATLIRGTTVTTDVVFGVSLLASVYFIWLILSLVARMKTEVQGRSPRYKF